MRTDPEPPGPARQRIRDCASLPIPVAAVLCFAACALIWIAWRLAVLCLWSSDVWTRRQKWLGTLIFPAVMVGVMPFLPSHLTRVCSGAFVNGRLVREACSPPQAVFTAGTVLIRRGNRAAAPG